MDKLLLGIGALVLVGVLLIGLSMMRVVAPLPLEKNAQNFQQFKAAENPDDKCAVPPGQDPVKWREHLSHHPDLYADCFK